jgi:hypothetical protein
MQILPQSRSAIESCAARKLEIALKFGIALVTKARMKKNKRVSTIRVRVDLGLVCVFISLLFSRVTSSDAIVPIHADGEFKVAGLRSFVV